MTSRYKNQGAYHWIWALRGKTHWYGKMVHRNIEQFTERGSVLDIGCGDGLVSAMLYDRGFVVEGVDSNPLATKMAEIATRGIKFYCKDIAKFKPKQTYDYLICQNCIEHIKDPVVIVDLFNNYCNRFMILSTDLPGKLGQDDYYHYSFGELVELFKPYTVEKLYEFRSTYGVKISK